ncbi:MAG TPA: MarC family protein [candidate division Zixibacteria bacterium]|nr:MarC family protein [candidate division Zixibacteria bacterium]
MERFVPGAFQEFFPFLLVSLSSVFFTVDPFGSIPAFLAMGARGDRARARRIARHAAWTCFAVLTLFASAGTLVFKLFGFTLAAFKIAGGLILFQIAMEMMHAQRSETREVAEERAEGSRKEDFGIIPLGVPMLAGPAAISTVIVLMGQSKLWWQTIPVFAAIVVTSSASFYVLIAGAQIQRFLGESGVRILTRLMGLILAAVAIQFVLNGINDAWPGLARGA